MAWTRSGDFDRTITEENSAINKRVIYSNKSNNCFIQQLEIYGFSGSARIGIAVFLSNEKQLELFLEKLPRFNGPPVTVSNKKLRAAIETDNREVLKEMLLAAHKFNRLDGNSLKEIALTLNIELPRDLDDTTGIHNIAENDASPREYIQGPPHHQALLDKINALENEVALLRAQNARLEQRIADKDKSLQHHQSTPAFFKHL